MSWASSAFGKILKKLKGSQNRDEDTWGLKASPEETGTGDLWGIPPRALTQRQPPILDDILASHGASRALLQLCPLASCMLPMASRPINTAQVASLPRLPQGSLVPLSQLPGPGQGNPPVSSQRDPNGSQCSGLPGRVSEEGHATPKSQSSKGLRCLVWGPHPHPSSGLGQLKREHLCHRPHRPCRFCLLLDRDREVLTEAPDSRPSLRDTGTSSTFWGPCTSQSWGGGARHPQRQCWCGHHTATPRARA